MTRILDVMYLANLEPRLSVPDFVSQLWQNLEGKARRCSRLGSSFAGGYRPGVLWPQFTVDCVFFYCTSLLYCHSNKQTMMCGSLGWYSCSVKHQTMHKSYAVCAYTIVFPQTPTQLFVSWKFKTGNENTVHICMVM